MQRSKPEAMRPDGSRSEGTPSPSERAERRSKRFLLTFLGACKKVSRRKGETVSGRYRSNGYVLKKYVAADIHPPHPSPLPQGGEGEREQIFMQFKISARLGHLLRNSDTFCAALAKCCSWVKPEALSGFKS